MSNGERVDFLAHLTTRTIVVWLIAFIAVGLYSGHCWHAAKIGLLVVIGLNGFLIFARLYVSWAERKRAALNSGQLKWQEKKRLGAIAGWPYAAAVFIAVGLYSRHWWHAAEIGAAVWVGLYLIGAVLGALAERGQRKHVKRALAKLKKAAEEQQSMPEEPNVFDELEGREPEKDTDDRSA